MIPNDLIKKYFKKLSYSETKFLIVLFFLAGRFGDGFYKPDNEIVKEFGISKSTLKKARPRLRVLGLIEYKSGFKTAKFSRATRYKLLPGADIRKEFRIRDGPK
jgi:hypothetical protein